MKLVYADAAVTLTAFFLVVNVALPSFSVAEAGPISLAKPYTLNSDVLAVLPWLVSMLLTILTVKETWFNAAIAYTPLEEVTSRVYRIMAFFMLFLNIAILIILINYLLSMKPI